MKTKVYKNYIEEYKKEKEGVYFYAKDNLLNKLYGFEDRGEFTIEVLDEMLELQEKIDKAITYINSLFNTIDYDDEEFITFENLDNILEILGDEENE